MPTSHEFTAWPKTRRLFRDIIVTEKLDGTNAAVTISAIPDQLPAVFSLPAESYSVVVDGTRYALTAQSRTRVITPGKLSDNYGFAAWVYENAAQLVSLLGEGRHYGEWWGQGIQRNYGVTGKRFSLFNTDKHAGQCNVGGALVEAVPTLYRGPFSEAYIKACLTSLAQYGSWAAPGFMNPEGVCVFHSQTRSTFKVTLDNQDAGKWEA